MILNEDDKYDDPVFVNVKIFSYFKKKERDYFWLLRHACFQRDRCKI